MCVGGGGALGRCANSRGSLNFPFTSRFPSPHLPRPAADGVGHGRQGGFFSLIIGRGAGVTAMEANRLSDSYLTSCSLLHAVYLAHT